MAKTSNENVLKELREIKKELKKLSSTPRIDDTEIENKEENNEESIDKGDVFEKYIRELFSKKHFKIEDWTRDHCRKHEEFVESDCNPDFTIRYDYKGKKESFAVECKFRTKLFKGKLTWSTYPQMSRYQKYQEVHNIPVFVVIGLGGEPNKPERMFCIPLQKIEYPALYPNVFEEFERETDKMFFWAKGELT